MAPFQDTPDEWRDSLSLSFCVILQSVTVRRFLVLQNCRPPAPAPSRECRREAAQLPTTSSGHAVGKTASSRLSAQKIAPSGSDLASCKYATVSACCILTLRRRRLLSPIGGLAGGKRNKPCPDGALFFCPFHRQTSVRVPRIAWSVCGFVSVSMLPSGILPSSACRTAGVAVAVVARFDDDEALEGD